MATRFMRSGPIHFGILNDLRRDPRPAQWSFKLVSNVAARASPECSTVTSCSINLEYEFIFLQMIYIRIPMGSSVLSSQKISMLVQRSQLSLSHRIPKSGYLPPEISHGKFKLIERPPLFLFLSDSFKPSGIIL